MSALLATPPTRSGWVTIQDAAEYFSVSTDTVRRMVSRGEIEARRFGPRLIRIKLDSIEAAATPLQFAGSGAA